MIAAFQAGTEPELLDYIGTLQEQGPKLVAGLRVLAMLLASAQHAVASEIPQGGSSQVGWCCGQLGDGSCGSHVAAVCALPSASTPLATPTSLPPLRHSNS